MEPEKIHQLDLFTHTDKLLFNIDNYYPQTTRRTWDFLDVQGVTSFEPQINYKRRLRYRAQATSFHLLSSTRYTLSVIANCHHPIALISPLKMDLLTHIFDENPQTLPNYQRIKRNDPNLRRVVVTIAKNQRSKKSICAAADIAQLGREIGRNTALTDLLLDDVNCLDHGDVVLACHMFSLLCAGINSNRSIEELTISNFSHNQWKIGYCLGPFLANSPNLRSVCVMTGGGCTKSADNMRLLVEPLLERNAPLEELCFIESGVDDDMVVALVDVFLKNPRLVPIKLQIAGGEFGIVGCKAIATILKSPNCPMETLDIPGNCIEDDGAVCLANALKKNGVLKEICLAGNRMTSNGWKVFEKSKCHVSRQH
jgi:hypothetical protein